MAGLPTDRRRCGMTDDGRNVALRLDEPPEVVTVGVGVHGTARLRDVFDLPDLWQLHLYGYHAELTVDGVAHEVRPGRVSVIPPGVPVQYLYRGRSEHVYAHLRMSRSHPTHTVPVVQDAGAESRMLSDLMRRAVAGWPRTPNHATAELWTTLWRVAGLRDPSRERVSTVVAAAIAYIEANLADPITVPDVAAAAEVSHNQLLRLFRSDVGDTVVGYVRRRRLERARHLLRESSLPIATVAASVGIADLQAFNKACRRAFGASPRAMRGD